jgi:hypothetical protein
VPFGPGFIGGFDVRNAGYPGFGQTCADSPRADDQCGGFMYQDHCITWRATSGYLMYDCDTTGGHSGSAVWRQLGDGTPVIMGVHKRGNEPSSGAVITASPPTLNLGPRMRSDLYGDVCDWIEESPSAFAAHPCE